jgi:multiple sugar transport system permease protein
VLAFKRAFDAVPAALEESALVDAASPWRIYWQIWMPLQGIASAGLKG